MDTILPVSSSGRSYTSLLIIPLLEISKGIHYKSKNPILLDCKWNWWKERRMYVSISTDTLSEIQQ